MPLLLRLCPESALSGSISATVCLFVTESWRSTLSEVHHLFSAPTDTKNDANKRVQKTILVLDQIIRWVLGHDSVFIWWGWASGWMNIHIIWTTRTQDGRLGGTRYKMCSRLKEKRRHRTEIPYVMIHTHIMRFISSETMTITYNTIWR